MPMSVACLIIALLVGTSHQGDSGVTIQCWGNRPRFPNGRCPKEPGQECHPANGDLCDTDLGYSCVDENNNVVTGTTGKCKGRYDLRVTDREQTSVTVEWRAFAPPNYDYEYILMLRPDSYHYDITKWEQRECGSDPHYTVHDLRPSTLYLIKVAIWRNVRTMTLGKTSETIIVKTKDVEFCEVEEMGGQFRVGESFEVEGEDNCTCLPSGELHCVPLCTETEMPYFQEGCRVIYEENSCEYSIRCLVAGESCSIDNKTHPHGYETVEGCKICTCNNGQMDCHYPSFCPNITPTCPRPKIIEIEGQCCPEWDCDDVCVYENKTYSDGEFFTSSQCGLCQCNVTEGVQCESDCPPVEMVLPDAACPDPHIRQTGCCDTLHCFDPNMDTLSFVQNIFAMSYTPVTLTLSFEVETVSEIHGVPIYCLYQIFYANMTTSPAIWENQIVQPIDVRIKADGSAIREPREALTKDSAIVVNMRAYVTLSGMHPNTTYYVRIRRIEADKEDMASWHWEQRNLTIISHSAMVVVKTKPLKNITSCFHSGREVLHGELLPSSCSQTCQCLFGKVQCKSACFEQQLIVLPSKSCPNPRLEKERGECCSHWRCYPTELGCKHNNAILEPGETVNDGCQECTCLNSTMHCISLSPNGQPPRLGCVLANISGLSCPQWLCPREKQRPVGIERSVLIYFLGTCPDPVNSFKKDLISHFHDYIRDLVNCSEDSLQIYHICNSMIIEVDCSEQSSQNTHRQIRSPLSNNGVNAITVSVTFRRNFSSSSDESVISELDQAILKVQELLNNSFYLNLTKGVVLRSTRQIILQSLRYICSPGFSYINDQCVLSEVEFDSSTKIQIKLYIVKVSSHSAIIQWDPMRKSLQNQLQSLVIKFKPIRSRVWSFAETCEPWITTSMLGELQPDTLYTSKLMAMTTSNSRNKWILGEITFHTLSYSGIIPKTLDVNEFYTSATSITLICDPLPTEILDHIKLIKVIYGNSETDKKHKDIAVHETPLVKLTNLLPDEEYTIVIKALMFSGETIQSPSLKLTTKTYLTQAKSDVHLMIPLVIACIIAATAISLCSVLFYKRFSHKKENRGFENKTYGMQLENSCDISSSVNPSSI